jgi:tetratricopeptide (TPR) repeat protein
MKFANILIFFLLLCTQTSFAKVGHEDLDEISALKKAGKFQQALEKQLWFHEESKKSPGMAGVRLSYAINSWVELGKKYPPALKALIKVRDKDKEALLSGKGDFQNFHDLYAINEGLGQEEETLELFLILDKEFPGQSESYYIVAEDILIKNKQYKICAKYIGDPIIKYEGLRHNRELQISFAKTNPKLNNKNFLEFADQNFLDDVIKLIEVLIAIENQEDAIEIQKRALAYFPNNKIKNAIKQTP